MKLVMLFLLAVLTEPVFAQEQIVTLVSGLNHTDQQNYSTLVGNYHCNLQNQDIAGYKEWDLNAYDTSGYINAVGGNNLQTTSASENDTVDNSTCQCTYIRLLPKTAYASHSCINIYSWYTTSSLCTH